jgi:hypothetical protein
MEFLSFNRRHVIPLSRREAAGFFNAHVNVLVMFFPVECPMLR